MTENVIVLSEPACQSVLVDLVVQSLDAQGDPAPLVLVERPCATVHVEQHAALLLSQPSQSPILFQLVECPQVILGGVQGPPGAGVPGTGGGGDPPPFFLGAAETYRIPLYRQVLYSVPIEVEGLMVDEGGILVETCMGSA